MQKNFELEPITVWPKFNIKTKAELAKAMTNKAWRLSHLYHIPNKQGICTRFVPKEVQKLFLANMWYSNVILKSRQHGISTVIALWLLDECLFHDGYSAAIISETEDRAMDLFKTKIRFPYERLPEDLRIALPLSKDNSMEYSFKNGSSLTVATGFRGGTLQAIHVSELGKISIKYPEKAKEIISGALETVAPGQLRFVESTAEGQSGYFPDMCKRAQKIQIQETKLTVLDYKFHFYGWFQDPECSLEVGDSWDVQPDMESYFIKIEKKCNIKLTNGQKLFYIKKKENLGDDVLKEYPSTWEECFSSSIQGTFFHSQFQTLRKNKQICNVPAKEGILVDCYWDIGFRDPTAIWFCQNVGREIHVIDFYEKNNEGMAFFAKVLQDKGYRYGRMVGPHDIGDHEFCIGKTRIEFAKSYGLNFIAAPLIHLPDQVEAARNIFPLCWFDEKKCAIGLEYLENYRKEWDDKRGAWKSQPLHDRCSHGSSAFMTMAISHQFTQTSGLTVRRREVEVNNSYCW